MPLVPYLNYPIQTYYPDTGNQPLPYPSNPENQAPVGTNIYFISLYFDSAGDWSHLLHGMRAPYPLDHHVDDGESGGQLSSIITDLVRNWAHTRWENL